MMMMMLFATQVAGVQTPSSATACQWARNYATLAVSCEKKRPQSMLLDEHNKENTFN
jgi:hypothetical protein